MTSDAAAATVTAASPPHPVSAPTEADWHAAVNAIRSVPVDARVLLICHVNPDGDALGSMLGVALGLRQLGLCSVQATFPGPLELPEPLQGMPGADLLVPASAAYPTPDLVLCFDAASVSRLGDLADRIRLAATTIVLDHHASNPGFGNIRLIDSQAAATAVLAERLLDRLDVRLDRSIAECLYIALVTDTGSFRFAVTTAAVHHMAARLLATGVQPGEISRRIFDTRPFGAIRLYGQVLIRAQLEPTAAAGRGMVWSYATLADLDGHGQQPWVLEPLIDAIRPAAEADVSCLLKQVAAGKWAVSLRSRGATDVGWVAVALGGGGHRLAAGFTAYGEPAEVISAIRAELSRYASGSQNPE